MSTLARKPDPALRSLVRRLGILQSLPAISAMYLNQKDSISQNFKTIEHEAIIRSPQREREVRLFAYSPILGASFFFGLGLL